MYSFAPAWIAATAARASVALVEAADSACAVRSPTRRKRRWRDRAFHPTAAARDGRAGGSAATSIALLLDDFRHGDAELVFDQHDFAPRHQPVVHVDVDRLA